MPESAASDRAASIEIAGFVEDPALEGERLIGAQAIGVRPDRADGERLGLRQFAGETLERTAAREMPVFERPLVDLGGDDLRVKPDGRQERPAASDSSTPESVAEPRATARAVALASPLKFEPSPSSVSRRR